MLVSSRAVLSPKHLSKGETLKEDLQYLHFGASLREADVDPDEGGSASTSTPVVPTDLLPRILPRAVIAMCSQLDSTVQGQLA
jgi:hypothetical protein